MDVVAQGLLLRELAPGISLADVREATGADVLVDGDVPEMEF